MNKKNVELIQFKKKYQNKWVALSPKTGQVLDSGKDLTKIVYKLSVQKKEYVLEKVLPLNTLFIPLTLSS